MKLISVVTPCYNEEENVADVYRRVKEVFASLKDYDYEHIFTSVNYFSKTKSEFRNKLYALLMIFLSCACASISSTSFLLK